MGYAGCMAYISFRHICLHTCLIGLMMLCAPTVFGATSETADSYYFQVMGTPVKVPKQAMTSHNSAFFLSADESSIIAVTQAHGMHQEKSAQPGDAWRRFVFDEIDAGQRYVALDVTLIATQVDGQPLWWVRPEPAPQQDNIENVCQRSADEPWTLFNHGLAHISRIRPSVTPSVNVAPVQEVTRVDLRHAAALLPADWKGHVDHEGCAVQDGEDTLPLNSQWVADSVVWHSAVHGKKLALTFDACSTYSYGPFNPEVIAALKALEVPATLFVGGHSTLR